MAASRTVIVLAPNGRRQNVKITLNTTILQVLEEVCRKQGYNVDDYDIKHVHRILDLNTTFRFTGLANNAQLEMVACAKARSMSNVTIGIQPEDGERIMREFSPNTTLLQVLTDIYPDSDVERAVLIYMHSEICSKEALERTTLKSLGLNSGKAILRLIYRDPEQLKTQAHVSTVLLPKPVAAIDNSSSDQNTQEVPSPTPHCSKATNDITLSTRSDIANTEKQEKLNSKTKMNASPPAEMKMDTEDEAEMNTASERNIVTVDETKMDTGDEAKMSTVNEIMVDIADETKGDIKDDARMDIEDKIIVRSGNQETDVSATGRTHFVAFDRTDRDTEKSQITEACTRDQEDTYKIEFLGERNALVFNQAGTKALPKDELPDSFFELDLHDARTLLRDAKCRREQYESAPFLTESRRQLERDKRMLDQLNKYRRTVIRIQFPDQFVLQGLFGPLESIQTVKDFIKDYLDNPYCEFIIYTAPPKHILKPEARLIDENLIPSAIVYYSGQSSLKPSVKSKLTDPRAAGIEAVKSRTDNMRKNQDTTTRDNTNASIKNKSDRVIPGPSTRESSLSARNENRKPKWFKP